MFLTYKKDFYKEYKCNIEFDDILRVLEKLWLKILLFSHFIYEIFVSKLNSEFYLWRI